MQQRLAPEIRLSVVVVGSEGQASQDLAHSFDFDYLEQPNLPLNQKWNAGAAYARLLNPEALIIMGSDDWVNDQHLLFCQDKIQQGLDFFGLSSAYFYDLQTSRGGLYQHTQNTRVGIGRCLSRKTLNAVNWQPWRSGVINCRLDAALLNRVGWDKHQAFNPAKEGIFALDIKFENNIWPYDSLLHALKPVPDIEDLLYQHFETEVVDRLLALKISEVT